MKVHQSFNAEFSFLIKLKIADLWNIVSETSKEWNTYESQGHTEVNTLNNDKVYNCSSIWNIDFQELIILKHPVFSILNKSHETQGTNIFSVGVTNIENGP